MKKMPIIFIMGHTCSGKTNISINIKNKYKNNVDLISVDSSSIYRYMDIGTSKPDKNILLKFPYYLINIRDPIQKYSSLEFYNDSINIIKKIYNKNIIPIFCGGTMFYFYTLLNGIHNYIYDINNINKYINNNINISNSYYILNKLKNIILDDKITNINKNNIKRIRKISSIFITNGYTKNKIGILNNSNYKIYIFYLMNDDSKYNIYKTLKNRFLKMILEGLENEVYILYKRNDLNINMQSIKSIGYKNMWLYFMKKISYNESINLSILDTINLFKKQLKWIKKFNKLKIILNNNDNKKILYKKINYILYKYLN